MRRHVIGWTALAATFVTLWSVPVSTQNGRGRRSVIEQVNGREVASGEVLVKFRGGDAPDVAQIAGQTDADTVESLGRSRLLRVRSNSLNVNALVDLLKGRADVEYVEPNFVVHALDLPNDPMFPQLWGLLNTGQAVNGGLAGTAGADIHAVPAWGVTTGSTDHVVAVIDTGIDYTHPDLMDNIWSAPADFTVTIGGVPVSCPAGSHGFNAIAMSCDPMDDHNHGTHVSGTIGAVGNNSVGVIGVSPVSRLMAIKFLDSTGAGTTADAIKSIDFAIQVKQAFASTGGANVRILSNSWGGDDNSQALLDEINAANAADMLFVAAAGNSGLPTESFPTYPGSFIAPNLINVGASTNADGHAWFSSWSSTGVAVIAPGDDILSTTIGNTYTFFSGTSMATPHVSGAASLVLSVCSLNTAELKATILNTAESIPGLANYAVNGGRLDVNSAVRSCSVPPDAPGNLTALGRDSQVILAWTGGSGSTGFTVKRSLTSGSGYTTVAADVRSKTYTDTSVTNGTTYYYVVSGRNTVGESSDSNEASATPKAPSDLVVSLTAPNVGGAGLPITVGVTTRNQSGATANPTVTKLYLSSKPVLDGTATLVNSSGVPQLGPGASSTTNVTFTIPDNQGVGTRYLIAQADAEGTEFETQENNNTTLRSIQLGPDLIVASITAPATAASGATISVADMVKNQGGASADATVTRFYFSTNFSLDGGDPQIGSRAVPSLAAGLSNSGSTNITLPSGLTSGTYYIIAKADADDTVAESNQQNNTLTRSIQIGGDLIVSALTVPLKARAGDSIIVTDTTVNQGSGDVPASTTRFYLSANAILDSGDIPLQNSRAVPALAAGASSTGNTTLLIPDTVTTGQYYIFAKADGDDAIVETQETNNTTPRAIQIGGDLIVSALTVPVRGANGGTITVTDTTMNQGAGPIGASTVRFFLSANSVLDSSDTPLNPGRAVPALGPGVSNSGQTTLTLPTGLAPGNYYIIAKADGDDAVVETQEANNTNGRSIAIGPDLTVSSMTLPSLAHAGASITIADVVSNAGLDPADASTLKIYLSTNTTVDFGDTLLVTRSVPSIAGGGTNTGSSGATIPAGLTPGTYYVIAQIDTDNVVTETSELNNTLVRILTVQP